MPWDGFIEDCMGTKSQALIEDSQGLEEYLESLDGTYYGISDEGGILMRGKSISLPKAFRSLLQVQHIRFPGTRMFTC